MHGWGMQGTLPSAVQLTLAPRACCTPKCTCSLLSCLLACLLALQPLTTHYIIPTFPLKDQVRSLTVDQLTRSQREQRTNVKGLWTPHPSTLNEKNSVYHSPVLTRTSIKGQSITATRTGSRRQACARLVHIHMPV